MLRFRSSLVVFGALAVCAAGCTSGTSPKGSASSSTLATVRATVPVAGSTTSSVPSSGEPTTTAPLAPGQTPITSNSTAAGATTTAASRVVSKPSDNVHLGDTGSGVKQIQTALAAHGYKVTIDGSFGPLTAQAVKAFQKAAGLKQDGIVGPVTWAKLQSAPTTTTTPGSTTTTVKTTTTTAH